MTFVDLAIFAQIILIDIVLSGDNAVVIGMAAAGLPDKQRRGAIAIGMGLAIALRVGLSLTAVKIIAYPAFSFFGGLALCWVAAKMLQDLRQEEETKSQRSLLKKSFMVAIIEIVLADASMSLDNILAVAGAAQGNMWALGTGLVLSIALMAVAADIIARLINKWRWIAYVGLILIVGIAVEMLYVSTPKMIDICRPYLMAG